MTTVVLLCCLARVHAADRPNIILILSDDMGFSDIGCYGGEIRTPNLDRLAENGLRFTQFYNTGRCCPTRASLLTGLYSHQAGVGHMMNDRGHDGYRGNLNQHCRTLAEALKPAGYAAYLAGKWHVTLHTAPDGPKSNWPLQRGFDRFYGTIHGAGSFYDPNSLTRDNTQVSPFADPVYQPETYYYTDAISDNAVMFVDDHCRKTPGKPFFMYVAYTAAHWPMHALEKDIAKYKGAYDAGYEAIRKRRHTKMVDLGIVEPGWNVTPGAARWGEVENRDWEIRCMEVYAAMVDNMDQGIGRIVKSLERHDQLDNTLIFFLQDNGGCAEGFGRGGKQPHKTRTEQPTLAPMARDALQVAMVPEQTRDGYPTLQGPGIMPGPDGTFIAYGRAWANVSNTPFREYKHWVHEGGIATPLIAHWPRGIPHARHGSIEHQPGHLIDIMATCVDLAGADYPAEVDGMTITPLEGVSLAPAFQGKSLERPNPLFWEHERNAAIRDGKWKLVGKNVVKSEQPDRAGWELYDMEADRSEMQNLAASRPDLVDSLEAKWTAWARRAQVLPLPAKK